MKLSDYIIEYIKSKGLNRVYGLSGRYNEALYISAEEKQIEIIQNIHENNSVFFASGDYDATNNINFVFVTEGPGVTNLITSTACSFTDNIPLIIISINNSTYSYGLGTHHDGSTSLKDGIDIVGMMKEVTSYSLMINDSESLPFILNKAYNIAQSDKKPVHISIPENFLDLNISNNLKLFPKKISKLIYSNIEDIFLDDYKNSEFPLFLLGNKIDSGNFLDFTINTNSLYTCTISNTNMYSNIKNYVGMIDIAYSKYIDKILDKVDTIFILNSALNNFTISRYYFKFKNKKIIHISNNKDDISFLEFSDYSFINSDPNLYINKFSNFDDKKWGDNSGLLDRLYSYYNNIFLPSIDEQNYLKFFNILNKCFKGNDTVYISVGGLHNFGGLYLRPENKTDIYFPGRFFSLGTSMRSCGYALSSKKRVFLLIGDGDYIMNGLDSSVLLNKDVNLNIILFNNNGYKSLNNREYNDFGNKFDFKKITEGVGIDYRESSMDNLSANIDELGDGVNLIELKKF